MPDRLSLCSLVHPTAHGGGRELCAANIIRRGDAFHRQRRSRAGEPWQQGATQTQQPVTPYRNGDITCRQTDVDRQRRHPARFPRIGGEIQASHQVVSSLLSSRLHLYRPSSSASSTQGVLSP
ncbi:hypothetical protein PFLUV_G00156190 [Perca fluviatilis]|uniref:Uncharacterized protein n=1 Tax=Perca fluviatilis TaxID=8168 RepID=A0A6A5F0X7_PERFL|nr:hypothetical protein PFLUV_G00156190 [Perca fluviatilis]